ncbi:MAG: aldehyde dehydrogenase family protein, partial [Pseudomonadota bacterium]
MSAKHEMLEVVNPYDGKAIGEVPVCGWDRIDHYLGKAHTMFTDRSNWLAAWQRVAILEQTAKIMAGRAEALAFQIADEGGKPLIDARIEVARAIDGVKLCIKEIAHLHGQEIPMDLTEAGAGRMAFTSREPIGIVAAVSAFNHPLNLIVHQVAPAIATGCPVIVKPANDTPLSCRSFVEILYEAGLPEDWCLFAPCGNQVAEQLVSDPRIAFFSFIGSGRIGWMLRSKLAPGTRCALEHGGIAPVIIDESADDDLLVPNLLKGGFYHSGQVCVSVQRVFAPRSKARDLAQRLADGAGRLSVGNAIHETTECGPLIRPREVTRVAEWVDEARDGGADCVGGGQVLGTTCYQPTVLLDPPVGARVSTAEIFGPVVCVYSCDSFR